MAELVQLHMENTIPEMEEMERIGLFTMKEIKQIIKKRKAFEYTLRRRTRKKELFLKYIQYEINVLNLILKRRQRLQINYKKREIDFSISNRIGRLFRAVVLKNQDDVKLWISQIEFCKRMKWHHLISALFVRMLQVHSTNPGLWVMAAKWEIEENNAPENARQLMQRALRFHPDSRLLWTEYFRMELMYTDLVLKRRKILGLQEIKYVGDENDAVLKGAVALLVYKNAVQVIPGVDFALSFIPICQHFDFTKQHIEEIFDDIECRHPNEEETLDALARRPLLNLGGTKVGKLGKAKRKAEKQVCVLYEKALKKVESQKMWTFYINFVIHAMNATRIEKRKAKFHALVVVLMQKASASGYLSSDLYQNWATLLKDNGDEKTALSVALTATRMWPEKVNLWLFCITLHAQAEEESQVISELFDEAFSHVKENESLPVWQLAVQWQSMEDPDKLEYLLERAIVGCKEISVPMKEIYLKVTALRKSVLAARDLYKRLRYMFPTSPNFYKKMVEIEKAQLNPSIEWLRMYFEDGVKEFGKSDVDLWLRYLKLEMEHQGGNKKKLDILYWRAVKMINDSLTNDFISRFTLFSTGHGLHINPNAIE